MSSAASAKSSPKPAQVLKDSDFNWEDPLDLDGELTEEERMVRDSARAFAPAKLISRGREGRGGGAGGQGDPARDGGAGPPRPDHPGGIRWRWARLRRLRPDRARIGARRFRL